MHMRQPHQEFNSTLEDKGKGGKLQFAFHFVLIVTIMLTSSSKVIIILKRNQSPRLCLICWWGVPNLKRKPILVACLVIVCLHMKTLPENSSFTEDLDYLCEL